MPSQRAFESGPGPGQKPRTILQIIPHLDAGGAEKIVVDLAAAQAAAGYRALIASEGGRLVAEVQALGGVWLPFPAASKNPIAMALHVRALAAVLAREQVDVVHVHSRAPAWVALGACRLRPTPMISTFHGAYGGDSALKRRYNSVMTRVDRIIAHSSFIADHVRTNYPEAAARVRLVPCGFDFSDFDLAAVDAQRVRKLREGWGLEGHERMVLLPGRMTAIKGQKLLIEAARRLLAEGLSDTKFILAGDEQGRSTYVRELDQMVASLGLDKFVRRVGHCTDMPAAYGAAAVVCVPTTVPETFGRVAVEAQAMGTPVIAASHGASSETVLGPPLVPAAERTGWLVPPEDAGALAAAIAEALGLGASARSALARRARTHVIGKFGLERMNDATLKLYDELITASRALPHS
ncbi:MAG: glycosyltransferase family 4 protein [Hyphomicrobiales bacterium]|nr:glycosyltransferase family 4 protein [Hyphomicrobiales bacterium]